MGKVRDVVKDAFLRHERKRVAGSFGKDSPRHVEGDLPRHVDPVPPRKPRVKRRLPPGAKVGR